MPNHRSMEMFSDAGNQAVFDVCEEFAYQLDAQHFTPDEFSNWWSEKLNRIARTHAEVWDTAVREAIWAEIEESMEEKGYDTERYYFS